MEMHFTLSSPAFEGGARIPSKFTCEGDDLAPPLEWSHVPEGTRSFVLIMDDPDAPRGTFTHWVVYDIPASADGLGGGKSPATLEGRNDFQGTGYGGPCPPPRHGAHRYFFTLYALDIDTLGLPPGATRSDVEKAMQGHVLAENTLMGRFER